jgi:hypothetical protein
MSSPQTNIILNGNLNMNVKDVSTNPSICIPRVFAHIHVNEIINIFQNKLKVGPVKKVDVIYDNSHNQNVIHKTPTCQYTTDNIVPEHKFKKVFIHFKYWNVEQDTIKSELNEGKIIKVVYDNPWFWKCSLSRGRGRGK